MTTTLKVPGGDGGPGFDLSMEFVYRAQARLDEIAIVNDHKAPELIACFARAYATLTDYISRVGGEVVKAKNAVAARTAIVTLDEAPRILKEKGLISGRSPSGSEDQRIAVLELDTQYVALRDRLQELEAYAALLKGKQGDIENGYLAVRKMFGESYQMRNRNLDSTMPTRPVEMDMLKKFPGTTTPPVVAKPQPVLSEVDALRAQFGRSRD